jgi:hypothetical protein
MAVHLYEMPLTAFWQNVAEVDRDCFEPEYLQVCKVYSERSGAVSTELPPESLQLI